MQRPRLRVADREIAVAAQLGAEEQHVPGTVHGLDRVRVVLVDGDDEHVLAELRPVARRLPERLVVDDRRPHLRVSAAGVLAAAHVLELVDDRHPLRVPERRPRGVLVEVEEVELLPQPAVVAGARLLEPLEMLVELLLAVEGRPVDARQLRVALSPRQYAPGERGQLDCLDRRARLQVRPAAEVGEAPWRVERDLALGGADELDLVRLAARPRSGRRLVGGRPPPASTARPSASSRAASPSRSRRGRPRDRLRELEVVVEAVGDRRPDRDLHVRVQAQHGLRQEVRGRVAEHGERVGILRVAGREDLDRRPVGQRQPQVAGLAVRAHEHRLLGEASARSRGRRRGPSRRRAARARSRPGARPSSR